MPRLPIAARQDRALQRRSIDGCPRRNTGGRRVRDRPPGTRLPARRRTGHGRSRGDREGAKAKAGGWRSRCRSRAFSRMSTRSSEPSLRASYRATHLPTVGLLPESGCCQPVRHRWECRCSRRRRATREQRTSGDSTWAKVLLARSRYHPTLRRAPLACSVPFAAESTHAKLPNPPRDVRRRLPAPFVSPASTNGVDPEAVGGASSPLGTPTGVEELPVAASRNSRRERFE